MAKYEDLNHKDLEKYSQPLDEIPLEVPQAKRPSIVERLLGTQSLMERTGFFTPEFDYFGVSDTVTRKGSHVSVAQNLEKIKFVAGTSGGMQNRIASLRYWTRRGAQQKTQASGAVTSSPSSSAPGSAASAVNNLQANPYDFEGSQLQRTSRLIASIPPITGGRQVFPLPEGYNPGQSFPPPVQPVPEQPAPSQSQPVPSPAPTPKPPEQPKSNFLPSIIDPSILNQPPIDWGKVYNANPGAPSTVTPSIGGASSQSVWQFLFNPEELQLDSGPDYNRAETWGVSDPANSGQPLSWKSNKNRKLIFGKVLLTGYVIGKRVDSLERGLQQLFMARDGENGNDGPPVLEFVWGARVFGPCVIQNIRVRERAWDAGALVNAEVSFELEQVPEWTINDGFVDIARPGRMPLVNDPLLPRSGVGVPAAPAAPGGGEGENKTEETKTTPTTNASNSQNDTEFCSYGLRQKAQFQEVFRQADQFLSDRFWKDWQRLFQRQGVRERISLLRSSFTRVKGNFYSSSRELGSYVDARVEFGCKRENYLRTIENITAENRAKNVSFDDKVIAWIHGCTKETISAIDLWIRTEDPCKPSRLQSQTAQVRADLAEKCKPLVQGQRCSRNQATDSSCSSVNGYRVTCVNYVWERI